MNDEQIREIFMAHGFTIKEGQTDLKPYVYAAARALLSASKPAEPLEVARAEARVDAVLNWCCDTPAYCSSVRRCTAKDAAPLADAQTKKCQTCNGHGMIGGPSYREPDEGGEPCPDCNAQTKGDERAAFEAWCKAEFIETDKSPSTGIYSFAPARVAWRAWKARCARAQAVSTTASADAEDAKANWYDLK